MAPSRLFGPQVIFAIEILTDYWALLVVVVDLTSCKLIRLGSSTEGSFAFREAYFSYRKFSQSFGVSFNLSLKMKSLSKF